MPQRTNLFIRPAPWGIGPGPKHVQSLDAAIDAVDMWLMVTPDYFKFREERQRMLTLREVLEAARANPSKADMQSAKLAIKGMVEFALARERGRLASMPRVRYLRIGCH
jgi:hypothetical protein